MYFVITFYFQIYFEGALCIWKSYDKSHHTTPQLLFLRFLRSSMRSQERPATAPVRGAAMRSFGSRCARNLRVVHTTIGHFGHTTHTTIRRLDHFCSRQRERAAAGCRHREQGCCPAASVAVARLFVACSLLVAMVDGGAGGKCWPRCWRSCCLLACVLAQLQTRVATKHTGTLGCRGGVRLSRI